MQYSVRWCCRLLKGLEEYQPLSRRGLSVTVLLVIYLLTAA